VILTNQINLYLNDFKCYSLKKAPSFLSYFCHIVLQFFLNFEFRNEIFTEILPKLLTLTVSTCSIHVTPVPLIHLSRAFLFFTHFSDTFLV